jgi:arsenite methyltransferase
MATATAGNRPNYGIDAPGVIRNLLVIGAALLLFAAFAPQRLTHLSVGAAEIELRPQALAVGICLVVAGLLMILYAKYGKFGHRDRLLALHAWRGDEQVLDVGTGRGLLMIGSAKRLTTGRSIGIDIWRTEDLSGNAAAATKRNIELENVEDRCEIREMPTEAMQFPDNTFDVVVTNLCLHNISDGATRAKACREIVRVLKPGGQAILSDFKHIAEYKKVFAASGCEVKSAGRNFLVFPSLGVFQVLKP